jgi:glucokinase
MSVIGISLSGTKIKVGRISDHTIEKIVSGEIKKESEKFEILDQICEMISQVLASDTTGIGFGVNSVVDLEKGIVFNVKHFPSWNKIHLKDHLEKHFKMPIILNNVCNCFALGEKYFGRTKKYLNSVALIIGKGVGSGIIINNKLFSGHNCMAGEFGKIPYSKHDFEYYCSENFFSSVHGKTADEFYENALGGDPDAMNIFDEYGRHLGNAIKTILYSVDPDIIVLGGSISKHFELFQGTMWESVRDFVFPHSIRNLKIEVSDVENIPILGAAALLYDAE